MHPPGGQGSSIGSHWGLGLGSLVGLRDRVVLGVLVPGLGCGYLVQRIMICSSSLSMVLTE